MTSPSSKIKYRLKEMFDEVSWAKSKKGREEKEWWLNHCHVELNNKWRGLKGTHNSFCCDDADESLIKFGKVFIDDNTGCPVEPNYVSSLLKSWGEPIDKNDPKAMKRRREAEEDNTDYSIFQVVKDTDIHSSLGQDISNQEPTVVSEFDCEDCAEEKANELNQTVTPGEKEVLGTEYKVQKKELEESSSLKMKEVKNPFGYDVPSTSEIYQNYKYSGSYRTPHDAWEAARRAKNHYDEYHGEDEQNFTIEKKDKPCDVCGWPFKPNEQVTFTVTQPPKIKKYKYNYGKNSDKFKYKSSVVLKTDRRDGISGYCNFIYYMYSNDLPTSKEIPIKEGDTVTGKTPFYYGSPSYGWYVFLNNIKVVNGDTEKSVSQPDKNPSNIFKQDGLAIVNPTKLFKKELQSKKNPGETYFLYIAINSHDGYKYSWFSKRGDFTEGTGVIGYMDSIYNDSIKLKDVVLSSEHTYKERPKKEEKLAPKASTQSGSAKFKEFKDMDDVKKQSDDIEMFVRDWIDNLVKPYIYDHDVEGLAVELAHVTSRIIDWDSDEVLDELGYEPDWDLFEEICDNIVEETVGELTYKEGFEDLNELFCQECE